MSLIRYFDIDDKSPVEPGSKVPYRVEMVGVTCDPGLAVARGIWRQVPSFELQVDISLTDSVRSDDG